MSRTGVMIIGLDGAIGSTVVAGVALMAGGHAPKLGMLTETGHMPVDGRLQAGVAGGSTPLMREALGLAELSELRFSGWDVRAYSVAEAVRKEAIVPAHLAVHVQDQLEALQPCEAIVCEAGAALGAHGRIAFKTLREATDAIRRDIRAFRAAADVTEVVLVDLTPTMAMPPDSPAHHDADRFEAALDGHDVSITAGMLYFYAAVREQCPYVNFTPNVIEVPALAALAAKHRTPFAGRDGKTGQTLVKTVLAPAFRERHLRVRGWFSANILGNSDGRTLSDPKACATKITSKASVLDSILGYAVESESGEPTHIVSILYYPPRGDAKESWDSIDLEGFLGERMQLKLNFLCKDSILAAPLVIDLARLAANARRHDEVGALDYLAMFFKSPTPLPGNAPVHDFPAQCNMLARRLEVWASK